jgi:hypothetical protein
MRKEVILGQISQAHWILEQWEKMIRDQGLPGVDYELVEGTEVEDFLRPFIGELTIVSHSCDSLATVLSEML